MIHINLNEQEERKEFALAAAAHFAKEPKHTTYTEGRIKVGELFAVRWGLMEDCVLTFRISEDTPVEVYEQVIKY